MKSHEPADDQSQRGGGRDTSASPRHPIREQDAVWKNFITLAASIVDALEKSVLAVTEGRFELVPDVETEEEESDRREVEIEQDCLRVLALYEPVASDLRRMATVLKVNRDWERIADLALRIARRARKLSRIPNSVAMPEGVKRLALDTLNQVRSSYHALASCDANAAREVIEGDEVVDRQYRRLRREFKQNLANHPEQVEAWMSLLATVRNLERMADHAAGIAQTVVYLQEGKIIRHARPDHPPEG